MRNLLSVLCVLFSVCFINTEANAQDTFTGALCLDKPQVGAQTNLWGGIINSDLDIIDAASEGIFTLNIAAGGTFTLTTNCSTVPDQSRNQHFILTGTLASNATVLFPAGRSRAFSVFNNTTGAFSVTLCANTGGGVCAGTSQSIAQGQTHGYISDGTNVNVRESAGAGGVQIGGDLGGSNTSPTVISTHLSAPLPVNQGGTNAAAAGATAANNIGALAAASNLSDLSSASSARSNLGLSPLATQTDPLTVGHGGIGITNPPAHGVMLGEGTSAINVTGAGTAGQVLTSNGASADPTFQAVPSAAGTWTAGAAVTMNPVTAASTSSGAHGLSRVDAIVGFLVNLTAEQGYNVGEQVPLPGIGDTQGVTTCTVSSDATNVYITCNGTPVLPSKSSLGSGFIITTANWKIVATPYKIN